MTRDMFPANDAIPDHILIHQEENTMEEMDYVVEKIKDIVKRLRDMSPLYEDYIKKH